MPGTKPGYRFGTYSGNPIAALLQECGFFGLRRGTTPAWFIAMRLKWTETVGPPSARAASASRVVPLMSFRRPAQASWWSPRDLVLATSATVRPTRHRITISDRSSDFLDIVSSIFVLQIIDNSSDPERGCDSAMGRLFLPISVTGDLNHPVSQTRSSEAFA
jgi:hypothetical protein